MELAKSRVAYPSLESAKEQVEGSSLLAVLAVTVIGMPVDSRLHTHPTNIYSDRPAMSNSYCAHKWPESVCIQSLCPSMRTRGPVTTFGGILTRQDEEYLAQTIRQIIEYGSQESKHDRSIANGVPKGVDLLTV